MSKKQERLRSELRLEDKILKLLGFFFDIIKPRRKENLPSQSPNQSVPTILVLNTWVGL